MTIASEIFSLMWLSERLDIRELHRHELFDAPFSSVTALSEGQFCFARCFKEVSSGDGGAVGDSDMGGAVGDSDMKCSL